MSAPELSRTIDPRHLTAKPVEVIADAAERAALARRFGLVSIDSLEAVLDLAADGEAVDARGRLKARIVQSCAVSGDDLPVGIDEPLALRFVPEKPALAPEVDEELDAEAPDEIEYSDSQFDLGEAVAQSLALAIDPYAVGPNADAARQAAGLADEAASGPFAALAALKKGG